MTVARPNPLNSLPFLESNMAFQTKTMHWLVTSVADSPLVSLPPATHFGLVQVFARLIDREIFSFFTISSSPIKEVTPILLSSSSVVIARAYSWVDLQELPLFVLPSAILFCTP